MDSTAALEDVSIESELAAEAGDPRRTARLQRVAAAMSRHPDLSFPDMMEDSAAMEGLYRILRNQHLSFDTVFSAHQQRTAARAGELDEVLLIHDTTQFSWALRDECLREHLGRFSSSRQGFMAHFSMVASADGLRAPLGTIGVDAYVHAAEVDENSLEFWQAQFGAHESEGERWVAAIAAGEAALEHECVIHVCDREADRNDVLKWMHEHEGRFVVRWYQHSRRDVKGRTVREALEDESFTATRTIELSPRSLQGVPPNSRHFPPRAKRKALLHFRACEFQLKLGDGTVIPMRLVEAVELEAPADEEPIHWILMSSEPAESAEELMRVIDLYRSRWLIEEFFKAVKTGCAYETRQLDSARTLLIALALAIPVAWRLLALRHLSRHAEDMPAAAILNELQIALLRARMPKQIRSANPNVAEALAAVAAIAGHHRPNGPPGWQILGRGLRDLMTMELGARLAAKTGLVIND
jgi:hypothetical protein